MVAIRLRWNKESFDLDVDVSLPFEVLRAQIESLTGVACDHQKILGVKQQKDDATLAEVGIVEGKVLMLIGSVTVVKRAAAHQTFPEDLVSCSFCNAGMKASELETHRTQCPERILSCSLCNAAMKASELETHRTQCPERILSCSLCNAAMKASELETHHNSQCPQKGVPGAAGGSLQVLVDELEGIIDTPTNCSLLRWISSFDLTAGAARSIIAKCSSVLSSVLAVVRQAEVSAFINHPPWLQAFERVLTRTNDSKQIAAGIVALTLYSLDAPPTPPLYSQLNRSLRIAARQEAPPAGPLAATLQELSSSELTKSISWALSVLPKQEKLTFRGVGFAEPSQVGQSIVLHGFTSTSLLKEQPTALLQRCSLFCEHGQGSVSPSPLTSELKKRKSSFRMV